MLSYIIPEEKENKMESIVKAVAIVIMSVVAIIAFGLLLSLPVMLLWNGCLISAIPGIKAIGWLQAWGILILCGMLFNKGSTSTSSSN